MPPPVVMGDMLMCSFGMAPGTLTVIPTNKVMGVNKPQANILDNKPFVNIPMFGNCMSLANPVTATLTAAALGVLTPGPCTPMTAAPWAPGAPTVLVGPAPALTASSKCMCTYGGVISVTVPSAVTIALP